MQIVARCADQILVGRRNSGQVHNAVARGAHPLQRTRQPSNRLGPAESNQRHACAVRHLDRDERARAVPGAAARTLAPGKPSVGPQQLFAGRVRYPETEEIARERALRRTLRLLRAAVARDEAQRIDVRLEQTPDGEVSLAEEPQQFGKQRGPARLGAGAEAAEALRQGSCQQPGLPQRRHVLLGEGGLRIQHLRPALHGRHAGPHRPDKLRCAQRRRSLSLRRIQPADGLRHRPGDIPRCHVQFILDRAKDALSHTASHKNKTATEAVNARGPVLLAPGIRPW